MEPGVLMMEEIIVRYAHFVGIIVLASMVVTENVLISRKLKPGAIKKLAIIDGIYGFGAVLTLVAGLTLWLYVGKPKEFYSGNIIFHTKLGVFALIALMSVIPTVFFLKNRNNAEDVVNVPHHVITIKRIELALLFVLPFLAVLIARGVGYA